MGRGVYIRGYIIYMNINIHTYPLIYTPLPNSMWLHHRALRYVRRVQLGVYMWLKGLSSVKTGSKWAKNTCLSIPNGPGSLLEKCVLDPFFTHFWPQNGPFSKHFGIFRGPKRITTGSKWAKNTCLSIPNGLGSFLEKCVFDPFLTYFCSQKLIFKAFWDSMGQNASPRVPSITVHLNPNNAVTPWVCLVAKSTVPYLGPRLDPKGLASMKEKHVLRCEALLGWCKNTLGPASVPHEVMAVVVGGIVRYAAPYLSDTAEEVVRLNAAIETAALQFENLPKDLSNVVVRSGKGLKLADIRVLCRDSVVVTWLSSHIIARL